MEEELLNSNVDIDEINQSLETPPVDPETSEYIGELAETSQRGPQITVNDFMGQPSEGDLMFATQLNKLMSTVPPQQTSQADYMPGMTENILKGYSQGKTFSAPIFVAGSGYFPYKAFDDRQRALQASATQKLSALTSFSKPPPQTAPQYQEGLNEQFYNTVGQFTDYAVENYGAAGLKMLEDQSTDIGREFNRVLQNYDAYARNVNGIVEVSNSVISDSEDQTKYVSPESYQIAMAIRQATSEMQETIFGQKDINRLYALLQSSYSLDKSLNDYWLKNIKRDVLSDDEINKAISNKDYDALELATRKFLSPERAEILADQYYRSNPNQMRQMGMDREDIAERMMNMIGEEITREFKIAKKGSTRVNVSANFTQKPTTTFMKETATLANQLTSKFQEIARQKGTPAQKKAAMNKLINEASSGQFKQFSSVTDKTSKYSPLKNRAFNVFGEIPIADGALKSSSIKMNMDDVKFYDKEVGEFVFKELENQTLQADAIPNALYTGYMSPDGSRTYSEDDVIANPDILNDAIPIIIGQFTLKSITDVNGKDKKDDLFASALADAKSKGKEFKAKKDDQRIFRFYPMNVQGSLTGLDEMLGTSFQKLYLQSEGQSPMESNVPSLSTQIEKLDYGSTVGSTSSRKPVDRTQNKPGGSFSWE